MSSRPARRTRGWAMTRMEAEKGRRLAAAVVAVGLSLAGGLVVAAPASADVAQTTIVVDRAHPFGLLPGDFVGLSYEMRELSTSCTTGICPGNFDARQGNLVTLYRNLRRSNVRIGGNQLDRDTLWVPTGQQPPDPLPPWTADVVTPADITRLGELLRATGWKAEVGINLAHFDPVLAADEARSLRTLGRRLAGIACGNEPSHYASNGYRPAPYGFAEHKVDWEACVSLAGDAPIAGPDLSQPTSTAEWFSMFARAEQARLD